MENSENCQKPPRVTLKDISSFLSNHLDDKDRVTSLEERTNCAIVLLESLPCGRYAVLEKIGEVFFDEAQKYVVELERLHLDGMPIIYLDSYEKASSKFDVQIRKIQQVLVSFVEANSKAWGPMIFQWTVQTLSQICGQYGTKRHFSSLGLEERFQMWLNCTATNVLLEIMVSCLHKIIHRNQDNCLKCLLNAALSSAPYFNWALAHICCVFPGILPHKFLCHALEAWAFSNQSRKIDVIIDTMLSIFHLIHSQKGDQINNAVFKLFTENMANNEKENRIVCTISFLLHIFSKSIRLLTPLIDKVLDSLSHDNLLILQEQTLRRDERRLMNRVAECIKEVDQSGYKILQFLIKYSCQEDDILLEENPMLASSAQTFCSLILEYLHLLFTDDINIYLHHQNRILEDQNTDEIPTKIPFLCSLGTHTKQLCKQMLNATGSKRDVIQEMLMLMAMQDGLDKMSDILSFILVNSPLDVSKSCLTHFITEFKVYQPSVVKKIFEKTFTLMTSSETYSFTQVKMFLKNVQKLDREEKSGFFNKISIMACVKPYVKIIAQILVLSSDHEDIAAIALELLQKLCASDLQFSEYSIIVQAALSYYFACIKKLKLSTDKNDLDHFCTKLKSCNQLLIKTINQYMGIQQFIIRVLLEGIVRTKDEEFATESEKPLIKIELVKKNLEMAQGCRYNSITSVSFKDGLRLVKRKADETKEHQKSIIRQIFINTLTSLLSLSGGYGSKLMNYTAKENAFMQRWGEKKFVKIFPSAHAYTATVLVELVCPEMVPVMIWPDEDFLKYTIERDLKVKNTFDNQPVLWDIMELISSVRPSLYHCSVLIQSLFGMALKFWQTNRNSTTSASPVELQNIYKLMHIVKSAGWLPPEINSISDIFDFIKPKELYDILSAIWKYFKATSFAPDRFMDRDQLGLPTLPVNMECLQNVKAVIQIVFLHNISKIGYLYNRLIGDTPT